MDICLNRGTTGAGMELEAFVKLASDAGFAGADVDLGYGVKHGPAALRDLYARFHQRFGGWGPSEWRKEEDGWRQGLKDLEKVADIAGELKIDTCATWIMPSSDRPFGENWRFHVERLGGLAKVLADHGLRLGLEFVAPYHLRRMFKHEFVFTPGLMLELAAEIGPNAGLLVDCFHCHAAGESWEFVANLPADKIVLAHLNDCPRVPLTQIRDDQRLLPGEGAIDAEAFLSALRLAGYRGPASLEVFNADLRAMPPDVAARKAWDACKGLA